MEIGQRVKYSESAIRPLRDYWNRCGREPMKSGAKAELERKQAVRGTVIAVRVADMAKAIRNEPGGSAGITVRLDSGAVCDSLPYMFEVCE